jgi:enterochelin esterase family protein
VSGPPRIPKFPPPRLAESPRVAALRPEALDAFWDDVEREGTPLVEPAPGAPAHRIVTFLWRAGDELDGVLLLANKLTDPSVPEHSALRRVPGTDVWHLSFLLRADWRATYQLAPQAPARERTAHAGPRSRWGGAAASAVPDPRNPRTFPAARREGAPLSVVELPDAPPQPWSQPDPGVPAGTLVAHRVASARLGNERRVWVHVPHGVDPAGAGIATLVLLDGEDWAGRRGAPVILDNLVAAGRIGPVVTLMPDAIDLPTRSAELTCDVRFVEFLADELLPWARDAVGVRSEPARTIVGGCSLGGLTALFAALRRPDRFGCVHVQSASLWWPSGSEFEGQAGWIVGEARRATRVPLRTSLAVGLQEWTLLGLHRHLRDVLELRGSWMHYAEYHGGHDAICWRGGLADGLQALLGGD